MHRPPAASSQVVGQWDAESHYGCADATAIAVVRPVAGTVPAASYWSRPSTLVGGLDMGLLGELQHLGEVFSEEFTELIDAHLLWLDAELRTSRATQGR